MRERREEKAERMVERADWMRAKTDSKAEAMVAKMFWMREEREERIEDMVWRWWEGLGFVMVVLRPIGELLLVVVVVFASRGEREYWVWCCSGIANVV